MRQNPAFTDDNVADAYTVVAAEIAGGSPSGKFAMLTFPRMCMEAIEYALYDGVAAPENFGYATEKVEV